MGGAVKITVIDFEPTPAVNIDNSLMKCLIFTYHYFKFIRKKYIKYSKDKVLCYVLHTFCFYILAKSECIENKHLFSASCYKSILSSFQCNALDINLQGKRKRNYFVL